MIRKRMHRVAGIWLLAEASGVVRPNNVSDRITRFYTRDGRYGEILTFPNRNVLANIETSVARFMNVSAVLFSIYNSNPTFQLSTVHSGQRLRVIRKYVSWISM